MRRINNNNNKHEVCPLYCLLGVKPTVENTAKVLLLQKSQLITNKQKKIQDQNLFL